jgi:hypothetical protein
MINSAEEFVGLRTSENKENYPRAANEPAQIIAWLDIIDRFPEMKSWVVPNKTLPIAILEILAIDPDPRVRMFVAVKNNLPKPLFAVLAQDENYLVRQRIALNQKTPLETFRQLAQDPAMPVSHERLRVLADKERGTAGNQT